MNWFSVIYGACIVALLVWALSFANELGRLSAAADCDDYGAFVQRSKVYDCSERAEK